MDTPRGSCYRTRVDSWRKYGMAAGALLLVVVLLLSLRNCGGSKETKGGEPSALDLIRDKKYTEAVVALEKTLIDDPENLTAILNLGIAKFHQGRIEEAIRAFKTASLRSGNRPEAWEWLGNAYLLRQQWKEARDAFAKAHARVPKSAKITTALATAEMEEGNLDAAYDVLSRLLQEDDGNAPALYTMATVNVRIMSRANPNSQDYRTAQERAVDHYQQFLDICSRDRTLAAANSGRIEKAKAFIARPVPPQEETVDTPPDTAPDSPPDGPPRPPAQDAAAAIAKARAALESGASDVALHTLFEAIGQFPDNADVLYELAQTQNRLGDEEGAKETLEQFVKTFPDDPRARPAEAPTSDVSPNETLTPFQQALEKHRAGQTAEAIVLYKEALRKDPSNADAWFNLGLAQKATGDMDGARDSFIRTTNIDGKHTNAYYMLGVLYHEQGSRRMARDCLQEVIRQDRNHADARFIMGLSTLQAGETFAATEYFKQYLELAPDGRFAERARQQILDLTRTEER
jgi:tetratricopeptide (TPR) repeat protein